ncbi:MAG TPA: hypothetical protein VFT22_45365 [Kofleriaceae bacterium]|nr:hypothetical protein [Kofleriaceae bacterium]
MKHLLLIALAACGSRPPVVTWASGGTSVTERITIASNGQGHYLSVNNGTVDKDERLELTKDQLDELKELLRSHHACELAHDPAYTPVANEGTVTLELSFPDLRCKVMLWDLEWQHQARDIVETMHSMRPLRPKKVR